MKSTRFSKRERSSSMKFGLSPKAIALIKNVFNEYPQVERVQVFGSRAMGTYRDNSDIDLVIWGSLNNNEVARIADELDRLPLPYLFDIKYYPSIDHPELLEHIKEFGMDL